MFNVRVYGILIDDQNRLLLADEFIRGNYVTKFPGGGLEFGEGTRDCLKREFKEETGLEVNIGEHFYTTDYFQVSAFNPKHQVISIYYRVHPTAPVMLETKTSLFDFTPDQTADPLGETEVFRWVKMDELNTGSVTLPIDKIVVRMLKDELVQ